MPRRYMIVTDKNLDDAVKMTGKEREHLLTLLDNSYALTRFRRVRVALKPTPRKKRT